EYEAPQGEVEEAIAAIWAELLKLQRVGRRDHFFELGGHSLLAVQLSSRLRDRLGIELPLRVVFTDPVLADYAVHVLSAERSPQLRMQPIPRADREQNLPLSWAQQRLWFLAQLDGAASAAYHMPFSLRLQGQLDRAALRATLDRVVARHENLRTRFVLRDGQPEQLVEPASIGFALAEQDLTSLHGHEQAAAVQRLALDHAGTPFNLASEPLIRGLLLRLDTDDHVLLINQHHIISDGWSIGVLVREVATLYAAFSQGQPDPLPELAIQYADYAAWQRQWLQGERLQQQLDYWRERLAGAPELLVLPTDRPRPAQQNYSGASVCFELDAELSQALKAASRRHGTTLFMTLLAAWAVLMARLSGQSDVVIGSPVANRQRVEVEGLIGFFVNTLALRIDVNGDRSVEELIEAVKRDTLDAYAHQDLPFEQVVDAVNPERSLSHSPLFQSMFTLGTAGMDSEQFGNVQALPALRLSALEQSDTPVAAKVDLALSMNEAGGRLQGVLIYASELFEPATIERWSRYFVAILVGMVTDERCTLDRLAMLGAAERAHLQGLMEASTRPLDDARLVHERFEALAELAPQRPAVQAGARTIGYEALNAMANRIAHRLIGMGIKTGDRVAICVERNPSMVAAVLGVLKAGAAFVPLDPSYPPDRLSWLLQDSGPIVLLTELQVRNRFAEVGPAVLVLDDDAQLERQPGSNPGRAIGERDLAYVIYTSGSTGRPKGVMLEHRGLRNTIAALNEVYGFGPGSRLLQFVSFGFDVCVSELLMPLTSGGTVHLLAQQELLGERLAGHVRAQGITHLCMPVAALATVPLEADLGALQTLI
ncbi:condensation domain-containing protein, partial [Paucibacter sp. APW11]